MKQFFVAVLVLFTFSAKAGLISVDYYTTLFDSSVVEGSFSGHDTNKDGWLKFNELDAWSIDYNAGTLAVLNDLGDYDYRNNFWVANAKQWDKKTEDAYMTWNNWEHTFSTSIYEWSFTTMLTSNGSSGPSPSPIPIAEPRSIVIALFVVFGMCFLRRKLAS